jgi:hypothetical protein
MGITIVYLIGGIVGLILTVASFIAGVRALCKLEEEEWRGEMRQEINGIK